MIKIENTDVYGFEAAIRGMRNPMNSWDISDSGYCEGRSARCDNCPIAPDEYSLCHSALVNEGKLYVVGEKDFALMKQLVRAGSDHSKFMRMITVTCDITAPMYWWAEMDTYKVGTVRNSCSKMHTIHKRDLTMDDFSTDHLYEDEICAMQELIDRINCNRQCFMDTGIKQDWWQIIQLLPSSYNQRATWQANYAVLRNIYHARKSHKLNEWHDFCTWIKSDLPYSELITEGENDL
jgi:hypothetical protein